MGERDAVRRLLDLREAATYLGISPTTLRDYVKRELIAVVRLPKYSADAPRRKQQFRREDLDAFIAQQVQPAQAATGPATTSPALSTKKVIQRDWWKRANA
jgi:hypothetical protein